MPTTDIVIVSRRPDPGRLLQRRLCQHAGPRARRRGDQGRAVASQASRASDVDEVILGQVLHGRSGPESRATGRHGGRRPQGEDGLELEPALRLAACAPSPSGCSRSPTATLRVIVAGGMESMTQAPHAAYLRAGQQDGRPQARRHHAEGRPDGRLPWLPHGQHGRERRRQVADHARGSGPLRGRFAEQGRGGAEGRPLQERDRAGDAQGSQGRHGGRPGRVHPAGHHARGAGQAQACLLQGGHGDGRQRHRASTTAPPRWC